MSAQEVREVREVREGDGEPYVGREPQEATNRCIRSRSPLKMPEPDTCDRGAERERERERERDMGGSSQTAEQPPGGTCNHPHQPDGPDASRHKGAHDEGHKAHEPGEEGERLADMGGGRQQRRRAWSKSRNCWHG